MSQTTSPTIEPSAVSRELLEEAVLAAGLDAHALRMDLKPSGASSPCVGLVHKKARDVNRFTAALAARLDRLAFADLEAMRTEEVLFHEIKIAFWTGVSANTLMVDDLPFSELVTVGADALSRYREATVNGRSLHDEVRAVLAVIPESIEARAPFTSHWEPSEDGEWEHFVCEVCGNVEKLPWSSRDERTGYLPLCHHGDNYRWPGDREVSKMKEHGWLEMRRAEVRVRPA